MYDNFMVIIIYIKRNWGIYININWMHILINSLARPLTMAMGVDEIK
jgi:hypothetical protein